MKFSFICRLVFAFALQFVVASTVSAENERVGSAAITKLRHIASDLLAKPAIDAQVELQKALAPYFRKPKPRGQWAILCTGQHCYATIRLRDDINFNYVYMHVPSSRDREGTHDLRPDIVTSGNNRIQEVTVVRHGRLIFAVGPSHHGGSKSSRVSSK